MKTHPFTKTLKLFMFIVSLFFAIPVSSVHAAGLVVNTLIDENDHSCIDGDCSLRDAIEVANSVDTITFSVNGTISLTLGEMGISKNLTITGPGSSLLIINANQASRIFSIDLNQIVNISGIKIKNGEVTDESGGAIYNLGTLTLNDMVFDTNKVLGTNSISYVNGGAVYSYGDLTISNSYFINNEAHYEGGAICSYYGTDTTLTNVTMTGNSAKGIPISSAGGAILILSDPSSYSSSLTIYDSIISGNSTYISGGGVYFQGNGDLTIHGTIIDSNTAIASNSYGGGIDAEQLTTLRITNSSVTNNQSAYGGSGISISGDAIIVNSTISGNKSTAVNSSGSGIYASSNATIGIANSTINNNSGAYSGGGIYLGGGTKLTMVNSTLSGNSATSYGGGIDSQGTYLLLQNTIIANSVNGDCYSVTSANASSQNNIIKDSLNACGLSNGVNENIIGQDPKLGVLSSNGGSTQTMALITGSPAIDTGDDTICASSIIMNLDQRGVTRPIGTHCDIGAYEYNAANVSIVISSTLMGDYDILPQGSKRVNYAGVDAGPVVVDATNDVPIIAALREAYYVSGQIESFVQLMGLPAESLSTTYYFPAYNNVSLDDQLRFGNVGNTATTVTVTIAGVVRGTYNLNPGEAKRVNYAGLDAGPVVVQSSGGVPIIAALRDAYYVDGRLESFAQLMGLPQEKLSTKYYFPAYNNVSLDGQLRFGNVGNASTTVTVTIAGVVRGTYNLNPNESKRVNYAGLDAGPVVVESSGGVPITAALRDAYFVDGKLVSFIQLMGLPQEQLSTTYNFPAYNNVSLDGQLRFGNVGNTATTVTVTIAGVVRGTYNLNPSEAKRVNYVGLDAGPVVIQSSGGVPIIAALRDAYFVNGKVESFAQLMGLPQELLSSAYYFPAYNNVSLDGQLRFGVP